MWITSRSPRAENSDETDLTFDKAVRIAQAFESARQETIALRGDTRRHESTTDHETAFSMQSSSSGKSKTTQSDVKVCYRCNGKGTFLISVR